MLKIRTLVGLVVFGLVFSIGFMAQAQTPDGETPAVETVCDGLPGAAFGLCNAYCEAQDCDPYESTNSCDQLLNNYQKKTDYPGPPCVCRDICEIEGQECRDDNRAECRADCAGQDAGPRCVQNCLRKICLPPFLECMDACREQFCIQHPDRPVCRTHDCHDPR